jgi:hypothetical protein
LALLMALGVLVPSSAVASIFYVCQMTGQAGPSCCCASSEREQRQEREQARFERPACCTAEVAHAERAPAVPSSPAEVPVAALVETISQLVLYEAGSAANVWNAQRSRAPPHRGPPLYLENCSFLS